MGMGLAEVQRLVVKLQGDATSFNHMIENADSRITKLATKANKIGKTLSTYVTLPLAGVGAASVAAFSSFDEAMTNSLSIMGDVSADMRKRMEEQAKVVDRGAQSATDLAESYYFLASAGLTAAQSVEALPVVQQFATAGAFDMARATDLLTDAQTALGMSSTDAAENMKNMTEIGDKIVRTATLANASVSQFSESLTSDAATSARNFGQSLDSTLAVLGAYASKGKKASEAGNLYGRATRLLTKSYRDNGEVFQKYGIDVVDKATGQYRNFVDIIKDMENAFAGMTKPQRDAALEMLGFDALAQKSITPLLGMADAMRGYESEITKAGGTMSNVADKQMMSFANQMRVTKNLLNVVAIEIGEVLAPSILSMNESIKSGLKWWRSLSTETKTVVINVGKIAAVIGPAMLIMSRFAPMAVDMTKQLGVAVNAAKYLFTFLRIGSLAALLPFIKIIAIVAAVAAAIYALAYLIVGPEGLAYAWNTVTGAVHNFYEKAMGFMANFSHNMSILSKWFSDNWQTILVDLVSAWWEMTKTNAENFMVGLRLAMRLFVAFEGWLVGRAIDLWNYVWSAEFINKVVQGLSAVIGKFREWSMLLLGVVTSLSVAAVDVLMEIPKAFLNVVLKMAERMGPLLMKILTGDIPNPAVFMAQIAGDIAAEMGDIATKGAVAFATAAAPLAGKIQAFGKQLEGDFQSGMRDANLGRVLNNVFKDEAKNFQNPLKNVKFRNVDALKGLKFDRTTKEAEKLAMPFTEMDSASNAAVAAMDQTSGGLKDVGKNADMTTGKMKQLKSAIKGVAEWDAVEAGSAEALRRVAQHRQLQATTQASTGAQGALAATTAGGTLTDGNPTVISLLGQIASNTTKDRATKGGLEIEIVNTPAGA